MIIFLREKFIAQIFMWVIAVVFVIGSIMLYSGSSGGRGEGTEAEVVLKIDRIEVTKGDFENMVSGQMRQQQDPRFGAPDRKQTEQRIINTLIGRAIEGSAVISDAEVDLYIRSDADRVKQYNQYVEFGVPEIYKQHIRFQLSSEGLRDNIQNLELVTDTEAEQAFRLESTKAKVKFIEFRHSDYSSSVNIEDSEAEAYFQENKEDYKTEEQIKIKFVKINPSEFVTKEDIEEYYNENQSEFATPEVVKARHILKKFPDNATDDQKAETKAAAEELLKTVKEELAAGAEFADLAKTHSDGPSGENGGALRGGNPDLPPGDYFARGDMVKPFEEACFDILQPGEVSDLVETSYGFHIIKLEEKLSGNVKPFPEVETEIREKLVKINGVDKAKEVADNLLYDIEFEDYDTAIGFETYQNLSLNVGETGFFSKDDHTIPQIGSKSSYRGLTEELFDMEVHVNKIIETKNYIGDVVAIFVATVLDKKPPAIPAFEDVKNLVLDDMREQKTKELALSDAQGLYSQRSDAESLDDLISKYEAPEEGSTEDKSVQESSLFGLSASSSYVSGMGASKEVMFAAFNMSVGDVGGPFAGDTSVYIIELVERVEPDIELFRKDPVQKAERYKTILANKKVSAYDNWFAARKKLANPWVHEDYR